MTGSTGVDPGKEDQGRSDLPDLPGMDRRKRGIFPPIPVTRNYTVTEENL